MRGSTPGYGTPSGEATAEAVLELRPPGPTATRRALSLARRNPLGLFGLVVVLIMIFTAVFAPLIAPYDPVAMGDDMLVRPNPHHWFGTDQFGRDVFSRVVYGARVSVGISFAIVALGIVIGTFLGVIAGYYQRWPDYLLQRSGEFFHAFPALVFLLLIITVLGPSIRTLFIALTLSTMFTGGSRVIRGAVISIKQNQYVEAARTLGASDLRIMMVHVLPNVVPLAVVLATIGLGGVILILSGLGFLGLGVPPPNPDWGGDLSGQARAYFRTAPWLATFPGLAITVTVLAFNLLGDALRDIMDPRLRGRRAA